MTLLANAALEARAELATVKAERDAPYRADLAKWLEVVEVAA